MARARQGNPRPYARTARVNELVQEIIAEELERIDDERLELVTVTHVSVDPDLRRAKVDYARLGMAEDEAGEALAEHRVALQAAIARQARLKRTPELEFRTDSAIAYGARIEQLLANDPSRDRTHDEE
jgi:ribosome-binding factor A